MLYQKNTMNEEKVNCKTCNVKILQSTHERCDDLCMRCFMKGNDGFKPDEFSQLHERNLIGFWEEWKLFKVQDVPDSGKKRINDELNHYIPILTGTINGFFRSVNVDLDGEVQKYVTTKLKAIEDVKVKPYINKLFSFYEKAMKYKNAT